MLTVTENGSDAALVPADVISVAVNVCVPLVAFFSVKLQLPELSTACVPRFVDPSNTSTVLLGTAVPFKVMVRVVSTPPVSGEKDDIAGGGGGGAPPESLAEKLLMP